MRLDARLALALVGVALASGALAAIAGIGGGLFAAVVGVLALRAACASWMDRRLRERVDAVCAVTLLGFLALVLVRAREALGLT